MTHSFFSPRLIFTPPNANTLSITDLIKAHLTNYFSFAFKAIFKPCVERSFFNDNIYLSCPDRGV